MILTIEHLSDFLTIPTPLPKTHPFSPIHDQERFYSWFFEHFRRWYPPPYLSGAVFYHWLTLFEKECQSHFPSVITLEFYPSFVFSFLIQDGLFPFLEGKDCEELMNQILSKPFSITEIKREFYLKYEYKPLERMMDNQPVFLMYCQFLRQYHHVNRLTPSKWNEMKDCIDFLRTFKYRLCEGLNNYPWIQKPLQIVDHTQTCQASAFLELCQPWIDSSIRKNRDEWLKKPTYSIHLSDRILSISWRDMDQETQSLIVSYFQRYLESFLKEKYNSNEINYEKWSHTLCSTFPWDHLSIQQMNQLWFHLIGRLEHFSIIHHSFQWKWMHHLCRQDKLWHCPTSFLFPEKINWTMEVQDEIDKTWKQAEAIFLHRWFHDILSESTKYSFKEVLMPCYVSIQKQWLLHRQFPLRVQSVFDIVYEQTVYNLMEIQENVEFKRLVSHFFIRENRYGKKGWDTFPSYWETRENPILLSLRKGLQEIYSQRLYLENDLLEIEQDESEEKEMEEEDDVEMEYSSDMEENWDALFTD